MITIPAGRWYTCSMSVTVTAPLAGTQSGIITFTPSGTGCGPSTTKVINRCVATGLATATGGNNSPIDAVLYGGDSGAILSYTASGSGSSTCVINGYLL